MGHSRNVYYALALTSLVGLTGCERRLWTEEEIIEVAGEAEPFVGGDTERTMRNEDAILKLQRQNELLLKLTDAQGRAIDALHRNLEGLRNTVNHNADVHNESRNLN